jgi:hypothetical protein
MRCPIKKYHLLLLLAISLASCIKQYNPPAIRNANNNYLVVDGFVNAGPNQSSTFILSRSRNLDDDSNTVDLPELNATMSIISKSSGTIFPLLDLNNTGTYNSAALNLDASDQYQVKINTANGDQYASDFVPVKISAPIDSLTWNQQNNVNIFVNTHDPTNSSIYYKWDFVETWQHDAQITSFYMAVNGFLILSAEATPTEQIDSCWSTDYSNSIITATSALLAEDIISQQPITTILQNDTMLGIRFSILVRQIPLTSAAFNYWTLIEKNSQQLGTLFDPQPSELPGNIHSTINPAEPVIGYLSAVAPQEKRLFIDASQVTNWNAPPPLNEMASCPLVYGSDQDFPVYSFPDPNYLPITSGGGILTLTAKQCVDCIYQGGSTTRPSFW